MHQTTPQTSREQADSALIERLRGLVGRDCTWLGRHCRVVELLADEAKLVIETRESEAPIQSDQYGMASFRAHSFEQIDLLSEDGSALSDDLLGLLESLATNRAS